MNAMRAAIRQSALAPAVITAESGEQSYCFAPSFLGFSGHFPDYPILPAILQVVMAQLLAEETIGEPLQFLQVERAKFTRQLRPDEQIDVTLSCKEQAGELHCPTKISVGSAAAASFTLLLRRGDVE
ncbi:MAG: hypothetical protein IBX47_03515 [Desulfuromonadales bacterium]|nr:hypothetical protein [Desulfuromonadales bacterium]